MMRWKDYVYQYKRCVQNLLLNPSRGLADGPLSDANWLADWPLNGAGPRMIHLGERLPAKYGPAC